MSFKERLIPMNLQMFGEGDGGGTGDGNGDGTGGGNTDEGNKGGGNQALSFEDFLKAPENQAEFDRRMQKAAQTAVSKAQKKWQALTDDKLSEAEKLAQMTKEEKAEYKARKLEQELEDLKQKSALADMEKTARRMLSDEKINAPDEILARLVSDNADDTKAAVEAFAKAFKAAVGDAVKAQARQETPKESGQAAGQSTSMIDIGKMARETRIIK